MKSKKVLIILDGYFEDTQSLKEVIDFKFKYLESITQFSYRGSFDNSTAGYDVDSLNCIFNILGYSPNENKIYERAYFEALSKGYKVKENESILRCNLVKIDNYKLKDFTSGLSKKEADFITYKFIEDFKKNRRLNEKIKMIHCDAYRNLIFIDENYDDLKDIAFFKPHDNVGNLLEDILPKNTLDKFNRGLNIILEFMKYSYEYFKNIGYKGMMLYPWGLSKKTSLDLIKDKLNLGGAVISGIDLVNGMGLSIGLENIDLYEATGDYDTSLIEKLNKSKEAIESHDFLLVHINGCDELAHRKDLDGKILFLKKTFNEIVNPLFLYIKENYKDFSMLITGDHITNSVTGMHEEGKGEYIFLSSDYKDINFTKINHLIEFMTF